MENKFYQDLKRNFDEENFDYKVYLSMLDRHLDKLECHGDVCLRLSGVKKSFKYIFSKYKHLFKLKKQNDEIFSQILHDIKSPMLGIKYALENTQRSELDEEIYKINLGILDIIGDFLTLYTFNEGYVRLDYLLFSPQVSIKQVLSLYSPLIKSKKLELEFCVDSKLTEIYSNESVFKRIISNLISNAIKYSVQEGKIIFDLKDKPNHFVFSITNSVQKDSQAGKKDENSYGLGLFITKRLTKRIKASLAVKKSKDKVTFILKVPKIVRLSR